ncbi:MAG: helix-turn-helix transcriptional regulator, partial [Candidatus Angelobacter sp.]
MIYHARIYKRDPNTFQQLTDSLLRVPRFTSNADWRVSRLLAFIDEQNGRIGSKLADVCHTLDLGVTASHASRLFSQALGIGIREYSKLRRLHTAAARLQSTSMSVKEIAANLGYQTPADFHRQFKLFFRVTPVAFRKVS